MNKTGDVASLERAARSTSHPVIRRPQRTLTPEESEAVRGVAALNLQGALILGIVDPVPGASPMSEAEGAWVREEVWPAYLQASERKYPFGFARWATCERGTCWNCLYGRCDLCVHRQQGGPHVDDNTDWVRSTRGRCIAELILRPGGELCVWWCRCPCPNDGSTPAGTKDPAEGAGPPTGGVSQPAGASGDGLRAGIGGADAGAQFVLF
ncbi:DUF6248 family natural product biosynthesis protein [Streptomyces zaomyceticus]|uniref:DUF6248 family natural product biosynthesis protein n=1 Tax=Streptomyces zaomyceticus TaxID=68286 RepID=UPI0036BF4FC7